MKHLARLAVLPLALAAVPALATPVAEEGSSSDSASVNVTGNVTPLCILGDPSLATINLQQMVNTSGADVGKIKAIANQAVTLPNSFCNFAGTQLGVSAGALIGPNGTPPATFSRAVNYTTTASGWAAPDAVATTNAAYDGTGVAATGTGGTQNGPKLNTITVTLSNFTAPGNRLLVSGQYDSTVTVTLGPVASQEGPGS